MHTTQEPDIQTAQGRGDVWTVTELAGRLLGIAESRTERMHARAGDEEIGITEGPDRAEHPSDPGANAEPS